MNKVIEFLKDESGPTATEYAVMLALIFLVAVGTIRTLGAKTNMTLDMVAEEVSNVIP